MHNKIINEVHKNNNHLEIQFSLKKNKYFFYLN